MTTSSAHHPRGILSHLRARAPFTVTLCCVLAAGMFIWFKLRVVTGMPRTANAVPGATSPKEQNEKTNKAEKTQASADEGDAADGR